MYVFDRFRLKCIKYLNSSTRICFDIITFYFSGCFLVCWTPFFTCNIINAICIKYELAGGPGDTAFLITTFIGYINSCLNPAIYTIFNPEFRKAFKKILGLGHWVEVIYRYDDETGICVKEVISVMWQLFVKQLWFSDLLTRKILRLLYFYYFTLYLYLQYLYNICLRPNNIIINNK